MLGLGPALRIALPGSFLCRDVGHGVQFLSHGKLSHMGKRHRLESHRNGFQPSSEAPDFWQRTNRSGDCEAQGLLLWRRQ